MNYSQEIALTTQQRSAYIMQDDESTDHRSPTKMKYYTEPPKDKYGNTWVYCWRNGVPLITLGPHWWLFILALAFLEIMGVVLLFHMDELGVGSYKGLAIVLMLWEGFIYTVTALKNPGIIIPNEVRENEDLETSYSVNICTTCNITKDINVVHCTDCDVCVEGMDHHCPWTGKCIGKGNLCPFYLFVASTAVYITGLILILSGSPVMQSKA